MDKTVIEAYQSIKAPDSLRSRLDALDIQLKTERSLKRKRLLRFVSSGAAACFLVALILTAVLRSGHKEPSLMYSDTVIGVSPVALSIDDAEPTAFGMKRIVYSGIPLQLSLNTESKVSVSEGTLYVFDEKTEELVSVVTDITLSENAIVRWDVSGAESTSPKLSVEADGKSYVYLLTIEDSGCYICRFDS